MKVVINSRCVGGNSTLVLFLALAAAISLPPSFAIAVPIATTQVAKSCSVQAGGTFKQDLKDAGPQPFEQDITCVLSYSDENKSAQAVGRATAGFGPGFPLIGNVNVSASTSAVKAIAEANLSASAQYFFEITPLKPVPVEAPVVPVFFAARGEGQINAPDGTATAVGVAQLFGPGLNTGDAYFRFFPEGTFSAEVSLNLHPDNVYGVGLGVGCSTYGSSAQCSAAVDPFLGFDQATFDAIMGPNSFPLTEYYQFVLSENLLSPPVAAPEPSTLLLLGSGLVGLIAFARLRRVG